MCFETASSEMANGTASSVTRASRSRRCSSKVRRTGCARAAYTPSSRSGGYSTIWLSSQGGEPGGQSLLDLAQTGGKLSGSGECASGLTDLDQVAVGVPDIRADLAFMFLRLGEELGALRRPFLVDLVDISDANVEECACAVWVGRGGESDGGLVVRRAAAHLQDHRVALQQNLPFEQRPIEIS